MSLSDVARTSSRGSRPFAARACARSIGLLFAAAAPLFGSAQQVEAAAEKSEWLSLVMGVLLIALVCVGAFMGSKRGHLD